MKIFLAFVLLLTAGVCSGQMNRSVSVSAMANFSFALKGLGTNDAAIGAGIEGLFFGKNKLAALLELSTMRFIGDKLLVTDPVTGNRAGSAVLYSLKAGPQVFIAENITLAATYGPVWHRVRAFHHTLNGGFQASLAGYMGPGKKVVARLFFAGIPAGLQSVQYAGAAAGFRF